MTLNLRNFYGNILTYGFQIFPALPVYLNVTDLTTYNVGYDSFCLKWSPHRAATSYRIKINPFDREFNILEKCQSFDKFTFFCFLKYFSISLSLAFLPSASNRGSQEVTVTAVQNQYCFDGLSPDALYNATVYTQTPSLEGPGVSTKERTRK